jgi:hypothetical protein
MASDGFGEIIKWGVIIGGAYLAYEYFLAPAIAAAAAPVTTPPATTPPATTTTATPPAATVPAGCPTSSCPPTTDSIAAQKAKILAAAGPTNGALAQTASIWNWYFNQAYNLPQSTSWLLGDDGSPMTVDAYLALRQSKGFSGLGGLRGLGWGPARPRLGSNYISAGVPMAPVLNYRRSF